MTQQNEIENTLNDLVLRLVESSPFFSQWAVSRVDMAKAKHFLLSFDSLVKSFPPLIAAGAAAMEDEFSRTVLATNLFQECGEGDVARTHHAIYRKFLASAGLDLSKVQEDSFAVEWRGRLMNYIAQKPGAGAIVGVLAAGEFLAQPALGRLYPVLKSLFPQADQEYFTKHLDLEKEHVEEITQLILERAAKDNGFGEILSGFHFGLRIWEDYFDQLAALVFAKHPVHRP